MQTCTIYAKDIKKMITNLRSLMDIKSFIPYGLETMLRCLLEVLLTLLELIHSQHKKYQENGLSKTGRKNVGDVLYDVSLTSWEFLHVVCSNVEKNNATKLSLVLNDMILKGVLAPNT